MSTSRPINELDPVVVTKPEDGVGIVAGDFGAVVHVYEDGETCEVEVVGDDGATRDVVMLPLASLWVVKGLGTHDLLLLRQYLKVGLSVDHLPYRPEFEQIYNALRAAGDTRDKASVWQTLLNLRKSGALPSVA